MAKTAARVQIAEHRERRLPLLTKLAANQKGGHNAHQSKAMFKIPQLTVIGRSCGSRRTGGHASARRAGKSD
jgi:hypothetical protein